jgi:hypothetical protein
MRWLPITLFLALAQLGIAEEAEEPDPLTAVPDWALMPDIFISPEIAATIDVAKRPRISLPIPTTTIPQYKALRMVRVYEALRIGSASKAYRPMAPKDKMGKAYGQPKAWQLPRQIRAAQALAEISLLHGELPVFVGADKLSPLGIMWEKFYVNIDRLPPKKLAALLERIESVKPTKEEN